MTSAPNTHYRCRFDDCGNPALFYLVYGCQDLHIADTTVCRTCLDTVKTLHETKRLRCAQCLTPIASGQYQRINNGNAVKISTHNLSGELVTTTPNPDYISYATGGIVQASQATDQLAETFRDAKEHLRALRDYEAKKTPRDL